MIVEKNATTLAPVKPFQERLIFVGEARNLTKSGSLERCIIRVGSFLTCKLSTRLERLTRYKISSLSLTFLNDVSKKVF
jgi:hypothetical protein